MPNDLRDRLADLAEDAPTTVGTSGGGRGAGGRGAARRTPHARAGAGRHVLLGLHLPRTVHAPDPWTEGTAQTGPPGPLVVVGYAQRDAADGPFDVRVVQALFGVSAVDGRAVYLDLPASTDSQGSTRLGYGVSTLSPDGTKIGYVHYEDGATRRDPFVDEAERMHVAGWDVYDTVTGEVTELRVPGMRRIRGVDAFELEFSGDSQYLLTNVSLTGSDGSRDDSFVAWEDRTEVETAALLGVSVGTVKSQARDALARLRAAAPDLLGDDAPAAVPG